MNRTEFLIDQFDPIPDDIDDKEAFQIALDDKNIFLLDIPGQKYKTLKEINQLIHQSEGYVEIRIGIPLLYSVQVRRRKTEEIDQQQSSSVPTTVKQKINKKKYHSLFIFIEQSFE